MNRTKMTPGQDPDEFLYIIDSCDGTGLARVHQRRIPTIGSMKTLYCKPCHPVTKVFKEPISKGGISVLPIIDE